MPEAYVRNCFLLARPDTEYMFDTDARPYLDGYAIIPMKVFEEMGGDRHPAVQLCVREAALAQALAHTPTTSTPIEELQREVAELRSQINSLT